MSVHVIHELFRGLERTFHERLEMIAELIRREEPSAQSTAEPFSTSITERISELERRILSDKEGTRRGQQYLLSRIDTLEEELRQFRSEKMNTNTTPATLIPPHPLVGIEITTRPVLMEHTPERISEADRLLLNSTARKALAEEERATEVVEEEEVEEDVEEEEEMEVEEEEVEEEAEEEVEEEEALDGEELEEFEYKGATYYKDAEKNVFMTDEEGELVSTPIGVWSEVKKRIIIKKPDA